MIKAMDIAISHPDDVARMPHIPRIAQRPSTASERLLGTSQLMPQKSSEQRAGG
jgi:hypothetical protein